MLLYALLLLYNIVYTSSNNTTRHLNVAYRYSCRHDEPGLQKDKHKHLSKTLTCCVINGIVRFNDFDYFIPHYFTLDSH